MFSLIVSVKNEEGFNEILLPSLLPLQKFIIENDLPELQIIKVYGNESLSKNYNDGIKQAKFKLKFFVHEDIDLMDNEEIPLFIRIFNLFCDIPNIGLLGLVGTTESPKGWWWNCSRDSIKGHVSASGEYWCWNIDQPYTSVNLLDGMFLATNKDLTFSEDIKGFHFYDLDYCRKIKEAGYEVLQFTHLVNHKSGSKDISKISADYYNEKWKL